MQKLERISVIRSRVTSLMIPPLRKSYCDSLIPWVGIQTALNLHGSGQETSLILEPDLGGA